MSLIIIILLITIGFIFLQVAQAYNHGDINKKDYNYHHIYKQHCSDNTISKVAATCLLGYITALIIAIFGCLGTGVYWWLKNGSWLTISPELVVNTLTDGNIIKGLLLKETSWVGIQEINLWYLQSNLAWSLLFTVIVLILFSIFTTD